MQSCYVLNQFVSDDGAPSSIRCVCVLNLLIQLYMITTINNSDTPSSVPRDLAIQIPSTTAIYWYSINSPARSNLVDGWNQELISIICLTWHRSVRERDSQSAENCHIHGLCSFCMKKWQTRSHHSDAAISAENRLLTNLLMHLSL